MQPEQAQENSAIYCGEVFHRRLGARAHELKYSVFYLLLDLDEAPALAQRSRLFGWNQAAWFSYYDADHGAGDGRPWRDWLTNALDEAGVNGTKWAFRALCMPRVLGYAFNPISVVYCHRPDQSVGAVIYEVNNTFGERHAYVIPLSPGRGLSNRMQHRCTKALFVSPFYDMTGHYCFDVTTPANDMTLVIDYFGEQEHRLRAAFSGVRAPFDAATFRRLARHHPLMSLKVIAAIHLEALKLWLKGVPLVHRVVGGLRKISIGSEL